MTKPAAVASAVLASLLWAPGVLADWTAHADFSSCPRKYYPNLSGKEAPVATEAECRAQIDRAKRGDSAVCIRYSCVEGAGGSGAAAAEPGHELDKHIEQAISAGLSGDISGTDAAALVGIGVLGNALLGGVASSPAQQQQAQQQAEAQRRQEAEQARQQAIAEEQRKDRLLGEMQGVEQSGELELMTDDAGPQLMTGETGTGGELALMGDDDDSTRGIMGKRKAPPPKRNQPPAARVNTGPYTPGAKPQAGEAPGRPAAPEQLAMNAGPNPPANAEQQVRPESFNRGMVDGRACNQRRAGALCGGLNGEAAGLCQRDYNQGYERGARENERDLTNKGTAAGTRDRGKANAAMAYAEARGSCGNIFVQAYNNAFR